jgi:glycogen debranching enzyme
MAGSSLASYTSTELTYWLDRPQTFGGWLTARKSGYFDETPILISAALDAYGVTGDLGLLRRALPRLERGWNWLARGFIKPVHGSRTLIWANVPPHVSADWVDQVGRTGYATQLEALWYWATRSLGIMEQLTSHQAKASYFDSFASRIRTDINRLLWTTSAPYVNGAPRVSGFGHYRSWLGPRDYFELDSNFLCILYGIAGADQTRSVADFVQAHDAYLLGVGTSSGVPARVVYGDYARADYAGKHGKLGAGRYQSAYWPTVGALVALGLASAGEVTEARAVLQQLSKAFARGGDIREWYTADGSGQGAPAFGWAARMFLVALYSAYMGVHLYAAAKGGQIDTGIWLHRPLGNGSTQLSYGGRQVQLDVDGQGSRLALSIAGRVRTSPRVPGALLCPGCNLRAMWG